jgi:hypothetical protein
MGAANTDHPCYSPVTEQVQNAINRMSGGVNSAGETLSVHVGSDGVYGSETHTGLRKCIQWAFPGISVAGFLYNGPELFRSQIIGNPLFGVSASNFDKLQASHTCWRSRVASGTEPETTDVEDGEGGSGEEDGGDDTYTPPPSNGEGLGTLGWLLLLLLGGGAAYGVYYIYTKK